MTPGPGLQPSLVPDHWTPEQALAAFELIDLIRDQLWQVYGPDVQRALRDDRQAVDPRQLHIPLDSDPPF